VRALCNPHTLDYASFQTHINIHEELHKAFTGINTILDNATASLTDLQFEEISMKQMYYHKVTDTIDENNATWAEFINRRTKILSIDFGTLTNSSTKAGGSDVLVPIVLREGDDLHMLTEYYCASLPSDVPNCSVSIHEKIAGMLDSYTESTDQADAMDDVFGANARETFMSNDRDGLKLLRYNKRLAVDELLIAKNSVEIAEDSGLTLSENSTVAFAEEQSDSEIVESIKAKFIAEISQKVAETKSFITNTIVQLENAEDSVDKLHCEKLLQFSALEFTGLHFDSFNQTSHTWVNASELRTKTSFVDKTDNYCQLKLHNGSLFSVAMEAYYIDYGANALTRFRRKSLIENIQLVDLPTISGLRQGVLGMCVG